MASTVLIIRHAEKPDQDHSAVNGSGVPDQCRTSVGPVASPYPSHYSPPPFGA